MKIPSFRETLLVPATFCAYILLSPKWLIPAAAWLAPGLMLLLISRRKPVAVFVVSFAMLYASGLVANYRVMPFPFVFVALLTVQVAALGAVPFLIYHLIARRLDKGRVILFPAIMVMCEYITSFGGGGTWGSIAYSQTDFLPVVQLVSLTGIWGISFLLYWFNAVFVHVVENNWDLHVAKPRIAAFSVALLLVVLYGLVRLSPLSDHEGGAVRVAAITGQNLQPLLKIHEDVFGESLEVDPDRLTQTSPELVKLNTALARFIESPQRYTRSNAALVAFQDSLFAVAGAEAAAGARIIAFSEALMFTTKPVESELIRKGQVFARHYQVRLYLAIGTFLPGKIERGRKYIENKIVSINESGTVENVFLKNKPVPVVEGSVPGDGEVPVSDTAFGRIATSICYDADFPYLMRKAGRQHTDIMILPSGDWREVSPYHGNMARMRAVENGFSLIRPVSGATTIVSDYKGRIIGSRNFYDDAPRVLTATVPSNGTTTLYSLAGDFFPWLCFLAVVLAAVRAWIVRRQLRRESWSL